MSFIGLVPVITNDIHPRVMREMADMVAELLAIVFEKLWLPGKVPSDWKKRNVTPVFKREMMTQGTASQ